MPTDAVALFFPSGMDMRTSRPAAARRCSSSITARQTELRAACMCSSPPLRTLNRCATGHSVKTAPSPSSSRSAKKPRREVGSSRRTMLMSGRRLVVTRGEAAAAAAMPAAERAERQLQDGRCRLRSEHGEGRALRAVQAHQQGLGLDSCSCPSSCPESGSCPELSGAVRCCPVGAGPLTMA